MNVTGAPVSRSCTRRRSPGRSLSSAAVLAGRAAGIGSAAGAGNCPGHFPVTSTAWSVTPPSEAACSWGMLPEVMLAGLAGNDPGTKASGSDQVPCQKLNDTPPSPAAMDDRNAAEVCAGLPLANDPAAATAVPGAASRSCRTACGSAWPANTASAAPAAAATSVVSVAAASTTQCAVIRRTAGGPLTLVTRLTLPHNSNRGKSGHLTNRCRSLENGLG